MAHSPSFDSRTSGLRGRVANDRRWLIVMAALGVFAFYIASGNYSFTGPAAPSSVAETSSLRVEQPAVAVDERAASVLPEKDALSAETSSASIAVVKAPEQQTTSVTQQAAANNTAPAMTTRPPTTAAQPAAAAVGPVERWRAAGIDLVTQGQEWDEQSLTNVDAALSALPAGVRVSLGNPTFGQLHILVNSQGRALSGKQPYGGAANFFSTNDGANELVLYPRQKVSTILHELGHAYNLRRVPAGHYARVLVEPEMEGFLAATGWEVLTPPDQVAVAVDHMKLSFAYHGTFTWPGLSHFDPLEDFANSFAMYFYDPSGLKAQSPERYGWMAANLPK